MTAVYSCVRILAEAVAGLPLHLYRYKEDGGKEKAIDHPLYLLLHDEPNPEMSSFVFRETLMTHVVLALPDLGETTTATTTEPIQTVSGDVNADGAVTLADLVMLQRYLLGVGELTDWTAGDLCADGCINGLDLALMRQRLTVID